MYRNYEYNSEPLAQGSGQPSMPQRRRPKRPFFFQRAVALVLCAALFGGVAGGSFYGVNRLLVSLEPDSFARCPFQSLYRPAALLPAAELQTHPAYKSPRIKIHSPAASGSYKSGTLPGAFLFGKDGPFRPAGMRAQIGNKGKESAPALCLVGRAVSLDWKGCA